MTWGYSFWQHEPWLLPYQYEKMTHCMYYEMSRILSNTVTTEQQVWFLNRTQGSIVTIFNKIRTLTLFFQGSIGSLIFVLVLFTLNNSHGGFLCFFLHIFTILMVHSPYSRHAVVNNYMALDPSLDWTHKLRLESYLWLSCYSI